MTFGEPINYNVLYMGINNSTLPAFGHYKPQKRYNTMKNHETKDFYLTGALLLKGFRLVDLNRENGYTVFSFQETPELQRSISQYYLGQLSVDASEYGLTLRQLKGVMHNSVSTQNHGTINYERQQK